MAFAGTDLSEIDTDQPLDTELVSTLGSSLKETRTAVVASFDEEHDLGGAHDILYTTVGSLPAAGKAGRLAFVNGPDFDYVVVDNGSAWVAQEIGEIGWKTLGRIHKPYRTATVFNSAAAIRDAADARKTVQDDPQAMWREYLLDGVTYNLEVRYALNGYGASMDFDTTLQYEGGTEATGDHNAVSGVEHFSMSGISIVASGTGWKTFTLGVVCDTYTNWSLGSGAHVSSIASAFGFVQNVSYKLTRELP